MTTKTSSMHILISYTSENREEGNLGDLFLSPELQFCVAKKLKQSSQVLTENS